MVIITIIIINKKTFSELHTLPSLHNKTLKKKKKTKTKTKKQVDAGGEH